MHYYVRPNNYCIDIYCFVITDMFRWEVKEHQVSSFNFILSNFQMKYEFLHSSKWQSPTQTFASTNQQFLYSNSILSNVIGENFRSCHLFHHILCVQFNAKAHSCSLHIWLGQPFAHLLLSHRHRGECNHFYFDVSQLQCASCSSHRFSVVSLCARCIYWYW